MPRCVWHGCMENVRLNRLCCKRHWRTLNMKEKDLILIAWADKRDGKSGDDEYRKRVQSVLGTRGTA